MGSKGDLKPDEGKEAFNAAGYCGEREPEGRGRCTRSLNDPHCDGDHVDHYNGRRKPTDIEGFRWPVKPRR
jgi:hypothetical protein